MSIPTDPPLSRRAARRAEVSSQEAPPEGFAQPLERRARSATPVSVPSSPPSDVAYRTQVRPRVPHYDAPPAAHEVIGVDVPPALVEPVPLAPLYGAAPEARSEPTTPPIAPSASGAPRMRRRDFRPPADPAIDAGAQGVGSTPFHAASFDTQLEYHTQHTSRPDAGPATDTTTGSAAPPPMHVIAPAAAMAPPVVTDPRREQTLSRRELRALREAAGLPPEPADSSGNLVPEAVVVETPPAELVQPDAVPLVASTAVSSAPPGSAPTGSHWSVGIHDEDDPFENTFSREVGSAVSMTNTNALVLPEMPLGSLSGPVSGTGEIIITGMIDLPRAVSSTGTVPTVHESPDIDDLFDPGDLAAVPADAAPVSALRAVSSHTGTSGIMTTGRRSAGNTITTVLVASTVIMAVVAIGLFVLAAVNGLF